MNKKTEEQVTYSITLENLALGNGETDGENGGTTGGTTGGEVTLWCREDQDCVYKIKGKANAEVKFLGITIKLNAKGEGEYVYGGGKTQLHCRRKRAMHGKVLPSRSWYVKQFKG